MSSLLSAVVLGATIGSMGFAGPAAASHPAGCTEGPYTSSRDWYSLCQNYTGNYLHRARVYCRVSATGNSYSADGPKAVTTRYSIASCNSSDYRTGGTTIMSN